MTVDLLSVRLKEAKKELTNLKTAHKRGLGLLKLYKKTISLEPPEEGFSYYIDITVNFVQNSAPYPFIEGVPLVPSGISSSAITDMGVEYTNNGRTCLIKFAWIRTTPIIVDTIYIISSGDISSISQRWW